MGDVSNNLAIALHQRNSRGVYAIARYRAARTNIMNAVTVTCTYHAITPVSLFACLRMCATVRSALYTYHIAAFPYDIGARHGGIAGAST
jgi:hypothetical protein